MATDERSSGRRIRSCAPIRICDVGGWTDTWFASYGAVLNIAVRPRVEVLLEAAEPRPGGCITLEVDGGEPYRIDRSSRTHAPQPLLEAAIAIMRPPADAACSIMVQSPVPPGAATGTSAAVTVALIGALDAWLGRGMSRADVARAAHRVETELLGLESGVQDQICSAYGGVSFIRMPRYPETERIALELPAALRRQLQARLLLVYLGSAHASSALHEKVIAALRDAGPEHPPLAAIRRAAASARDALERGDLAAFGAAMRAATDAQAQLHPELVGADSRAVMALAHARGYAGWKVNGAGGSGGSLTLLAGDYACVLRDFASALADAVPAARIIPIELDDDGLTVTREM